MVWSHAKRTGNTRRPLQKGENLEQRVAAQLAEIGSNRKLVRSFFKHPSVAYITVGRMQGRFQLLRTRIQEAECFELRCVQAALERKK